MLIGLKISVADVQDVFEIPKQLFPLCQYVWNSSVHIVQKIQKDITSSRCVFGFRTENVVFGFVGGEFQECPVTSGLAASPSACDKLRISVSNIQKSIEMTYTVCTLF